MQDIYKDLRLVEDEQEEQDKDYILDELHILTHDYEIDDDGVPSEMPWYTYAKDLADDFGYSIQEIIKLAKDNGYIVFKISPMDDNNGGVAICPGDADLGNLKNRILELLNDSLDDEDENRYTIDFGDEYKGNPYDPEELPDEGMSQEEIDALHERHANHGDVKNAPYVVIADGEKYAFDTKHNAEYFMELNKYSFDKLKLIDNTLDEDLEYNKDYMSPTNTRGTNTNAEELIKNHANEKMWFISSSLGKHTPGEIGPNPGPYTFEDAYKIFSTFKPEGNFGTGSLTIYFREIDDEDYPLDTKVLKRWFKDDEEVEDSQRVAWRKKQAKINEDAKEVPWIMQQGENGELEYLGFAKSHNDMLNKLAKNHSSDFIKENTYISELDKETYLNMKKDGSIDEDDIKLLDKYFSVEESLDKELEEELNKLGFERALREDNHQYDCTMITKEGNQTSDSFNAYIDKLEEAFENFRDRTGYPCVFNVGLQNDGHVVCNVEIKKESLKESMKPYADDFEEFFWGVYDNEYDLPFKETINYIDDNYAKKIWVETEDDSNPDGKPLNLSEEEQIDIFKHARDEAESWDNLDIYNSHARYKSVAEINDQLKRIFGITNKILHESLKEDVKEIQVRDNENIEKDAEECPLPLEVIPNEMGINLSNVEKVKWEEQEDGQLKKVEIDFNPGDDLEEDIEKHDTLNPKLFDGEELKPAVAKAIMNIANEFVKELGEDGISFTLKDVILLGSNMSYNYTKDSDLDIHLIADSSALECPKELQDKLYGAYRTIFNKNYDITIKGIPAEVYVELDEPQAISNGIYSLNLGWTKKPEQQTIPDLDKEAFDKEFKVWEDRYNELVNNENATSEDVEQYINDIYALRKEGIASDGEYSLGNLLFKEVRNKGYLDNLKDLRREFKGKELSLEQLKEDAEVGEEVTLENVRKWLKTGGATLNNKTKKAVVYKDGYEISFNEPEKKIKVDLDKDEDIQKVIDALNKRFEENKHPYTGIWYEDDSVVMDYSKHFKGSKEDAIKDGLKNNQRMIYNWAYTNDKDKYISTSTIDKKQNSSYNKKVDYFKHENLRIKRR